MIEAVAVVLCVCSCGGIIYEIQSTRLARSHLSYELCKNAHETGEHNNTAHAVHWL